MKCTFVIVMLVVYAYYLTSKNAIKITQYKMTVNEQS